MRRRNESTVAANEKPVLGEIVLAFFLCHERRALTSRASHVGDAVKVADCYSYRTVEPADSWQLRDACWYDRRPMLLVGDRVQKATVPGGVA